MEITLNIPKNDYVQPTEVRQYAVQALCNYMLDNDGIGRVLHPKSDGIYRTPNIYIGKRHDRSTWSGMYDYDYGERYSEEFSDFSRMHGVEVNAAFKALINAGYHIFLIYEYGSWMGYKLSRKPHLEGGTEVTEFTDFID